MPWKESSAMEERLLFVARLIEGEAMADLCQQFGISRKTGYKIFNRYKEHGLQALTDRSRRPVRYANQLPPQIEALIVRLKRDKPHWGARKIRELLLRRLPGDVRPPAKSTIHAVLDRRGLVARMGRKRSRATGTTLSLGKTPNDLWCADYKGEFKLGAKFWFLGAIAIRSPSPITPRASCSCARLRNRPEPSSLCPRLKGFLKSAVCLSPFDPTMARRSPAPTPCSICRGSRCGGSVSASTSNASNQVAPNRTGAMSACT